MIRRLLLTAIAALAMCGQASAQVNRPIKLIVPFPAGGPIDVMARLLAPEAVGELRQQ